MTNDREKILSALNHINPSDLNYSEWCTVGMALKAEGLPCSTWDDWSRNDTRYEYGACAKKWDSFNSDGVTIATVIKMAQDRGWTYSQSLDWDDPLDYYEEVISSHVPVDKMEPWKMAVEYLEALFEEDEYVGFVTEAIHKSDRDKWIPANAGYNLKAGRLLKVLKRTKSLEDAFGTLNEESGAWIRINPTDGEGGSNKNITRWDYALVESDSLSIEDQKKILIALKLPIVALVESGGKSVHAIVKVEASDSKEYAQRVAFLYDELAKRNFIVDTQNKNCSRLSRLPGATRGDKVQELIATNLGCKSWLEWIDHLNGITDALPPIKTFGEMLDNPPQLAYELIAGILRVGNKMIITGDSKSGKTCLTQELAVDIAEGRKWLGKFQCKQGKVLYLNFEVQEASMFERFRKIYKSIGGCTEKNNLHIWDLRGYACPLDEISGQVIARCREVEYAAIILDPIYKIQGGDENSASDIANFCNEMDHIARETGASVIYNHHHAKGSQGEKKAIDRGSGSGVFARDPDAIVDLSILSIDRETEHLVASHLQSHEMPMKMEFNLREFMSPDPINLWFSFPLHIIDDAHILDGAAVEGSREANLAKSPNRTSSFERKRILDESFESVVRADGTAKFSDMYNSPVCSVTHKTLRGYLKEFVEEYSYEDGYVKRIP
jgi:RecA-family ATPase